VAHCAFVVPLDHVMRWRVVWYSIFDGVRALLRFKRGATVLSAEWVERGPGRRRWDTVLETRVRLRGELGGSTVR